MTPLYVELDGWAYEIEKALESGDYTNRGKLQRKHMTLINLRDKYYDIIEARELKKAYSCGWYNGIPMKYCAERFTDLHKVEEVIEY